MNSRPVTCRTCGARAETGSVPPGWVLSIGHGDLCADCRDTTRA